MAFVVRVSLGILLFLASLFLLIAFFNAVLHDDQFQDSLIAVGILVALLWFLWSQLPDWFRKVIRKAIQRKERRHER